MAISSIESTPFSSTHESLPEIYNFSWVTPETFDAERISFDTATIKGTKRNRVMYRYDEKAAKELHLTISLNPEGYLSVSKPKMNTYKEKETGTYTVNFDLLSSNKHHKALYNVMEQIGDKAKEKFGVDSSLPLIALDKDLGAKIFAKLVGGADGKIYTSIYSKDEQLDIMNLHGFIGRPALALSVSPTTGKIAIQLYQAYVEKEIKNFPLAYRE